MDYEKKYKEALERAKKLYNNIEPDSYTCLIESIFPELKNKDEKIRQELLELCKIQAEPYIQTGNKYPQIQSWIDWLERQSEQKQDPCDNCDNVMLNCHNFPCIKKRAFKQGKSAFEADKQLESCLDKKGELWKNLVANIDDFDYTQEEKEQIIKEGMI